MSDKLTVTKTDSATAHSEKTRQRFHEMGNYLLAIQFGISEIKEQLSSNQQNLQAINSVEEALEATNALFKLLSDTKKH